MILTEEEARTKWCPFAQVATPGGSSYNRTVGDVPIGRCVASECQAWRWLMVSDSGRGAARRDDGALDWGRETPHGYCGMAGKP